MWPEVYTMDIRTLLAQDELLPPNCFSYEAWSGLKPGIRVTLSTDHVPCVRVGMCRVDFDKYRHRAPVFHKNGSDTTGIMRRGTIRVVEPRTGGTTFEVLGRLYPGDASVLLFANAKSPVKLKDERINPWHGFFGNTEVIRLEREEALAWFKSEDDVFNVLLGDGRVVRFVYREGQIVQKNLSPAEMAEVRVDNARWQLDRIDKNDFYRKNGILFGVISLLVLTKNNVEARNVLVDFLKRDDLNDSMRLQIRTRLNELDDNRALSEWFRDRESHERVMVGPKGPSADKLAKRNARRAADAARRSSMKGSGGGGGGNKKSGGKQGRKGKRG